MKTINMFERFGSFLSNGEEGSSLRFCELEPEISKGSFIVIDMQGVENMTDSFANACFTNLFHHLGEDLASKIAFKNCSPTVKMFLVGCIGRAKAITK